MENAPPSRTPRERDVMHPSADGIQLQFGEYLFTLRLNQHHGFHGSLVRSEDDAVRGIAFHGGRAVAIEVHDFEEPYFDSSEVTS